MNDAAAFAAWMLDNVFVAHIQDTDPNDTQRLYDRINTRGLQLSEADRFRGKVIAEMPTGWLNRKDTAVREWNDMRRAASDALNAGLPKPKVRDEIEAERTLMIAWLIGRYAGIDDDAPNAVSADDVKSIGRDPYRFADEKLRAQLGLEPGAIVACLRKEFFPFVMRVAVVCRAVNGFDPELPGFRTAELVKFPLMLACAAAATPTRRNADWRPQLRILSAFLDVVAARRLWPVELRDLDGPAVQTRAIPALLEKIARTAIVDIRRKHGRELALALQAHAGGAAAFTEETAPTYSSTRAKPLRYLLARLNLHLAQLAKLPAADHMLFDTPGRQAAVDIEHTLGANRRNYLELYPTQAQFDRARNRLGALVLLPKKLNTALRDTPYAAKLAKYEAQNLLCQSLCLVRYAQGTDLRGIPRDQTPGLSHVEQMTSEAIDQRERAYAHLANAIWSPQRILAAADAR